LIKIKVPYYPVAFKALCLFFILPALCALSLRAQVKKPVKHPAIKQVKADGAIPSTPVNPRIEILLEKTIQQLLAAYSTNDFNYYLSLYPDIETTVMQSIDTATASEKYISRMRNSEIARQFVFTGRAGDFLFQQYPVIVQGIRWSGLQYKRSVIARREISKTKGKWPFDDLVVYTLLNAPASKKNYVLKSAIQLLAGGKLHHVQVLAFDTARDIAAFMHLEQVMSARDYWGARSDIGPPVPGSQPLPPVYSNIIYKGYIDSADASLMLELKKQSGITSYSSAAFRWASQKDTTKLIVVTAGYVFEFRNEPDGSTWYFMNTGEKELHGFITRNNIMIHRLYMKREE
jgi:hypothetical protein